MKYTEQQLRDSLSHIAKAEGWNWSNIPDSARVRTIEAILGRMMTNMILNGTVDVDSDTYLIAKAFNDVQTMGHFNFTKEIDTTK